jgi:hypothetical protein
MYQPGIGEVVNLDNLAACARVYTHATTTLLSRRRENDG